ncbi:radial spoke head 10 homolog B [Cololabis saira]|uniref:radial spoke head 10 homolog B n=1 Tax=Cololabis saira TaxID=129043 RepID=UPI002AD23104|nr:radial spoke head 10 homolog B [Cololabis saira]
MAMMTEESKLVAETEQPENDNISHLPALIRLEVRRYEGETCEGQYHGEGFALFKGDHIYKGMFSKGLMKGFGVFTEASGLKYEGEFVCNMPMGQGTFTWPDGSTYTGEIHRGTRHGMGTYKCAKSGVCYIGQWYQGKRHGKGIVYYSGDQTSWYKGDWVMNNREGWGERCYPSGNFYSGEWKNNLRHGEGTMTWQELRQQYLGEWEEGVQHGRGTHVWILRRTYESHFSQSNRYKGDFFQGQRHGEGIFYYAGGAIYEGWWKKNEKHGQGKFTFKDGRVFQGEFLDDRMMTPDIKTLYTFFRSDSGSSILGPDKALNIECVLEKVPESKRDTESKQVQFVVLQHEVQLRYIYDFYSRLGSSQSPDNTFLLYRLPFWRLLKDSNIHHHGVTLTQIDHFIRGKILTTNYSTLIRKIHFPFTPILFRTLLSYLVIVAYFIYSKDVESQENVLATCLSKLLIEDILPNAQNVKGFLFRQPDFAVVAMKYMKKCWGIYQVFCRLRTTHKDDVTMTCRHLLWMFKDLCLLDQKMTTARLLEIIAAETSEPENLTACLDLEITFLEFFEVLLGCAEVKCPQDSDVEGDRSLHKCDSKGESDLCEVEAREREIQTNSHDQSVSPSFQMGHSTDQDLVRVEDHETPQSTEETEEPGHQVKDTKTSRMEIKDREVTLRTQEMHQFFNNHFFPAFEHHQLTVEEKLLQDQRCKKTQ